MTIESDGIVEPTIPQVSEGDARSRAVEAVRLATAGAEEADAESATEVDTEVTAEVDEKPVQAKPPAETVSQKLDRIVKERERAKAIRREAEQAAASQRAELEAERRRFQVEREQFESVQRRLASLKSDPLRAMRELELDPEDVIKRIATTDPEKYAERQRFEALQAKLAEMENWKKTYEEQLKAQQEEVQQRAELQRRNEIVSEFLDLAKDETKFPNFASAYGDDPEYQVRLGHRAADHIREHLGYNPSREEILQYLEHETAKKRGTRKVAKSSPGVGSQVLPKTLSRSELNDKAGNAPRVPDDMEDRRALANRAIRELARKDDEDVLKDAES